MVQKTAVEQLIEQVKSKEWQDMFIWHKEEVFEQAKQMEREQIINAHIEGQPLYSCQSEKAEEYYNQTYNQDKCFNCGNEKGNYALYCEFCRQ